MFLALYFLKTKCQASKIFQTKYTNDKKKIPAFACNSKV